MDNNWITGIDKTWTLFLDRDGVINHEISGDYVRNIQQLVLYENMQATIATCFKKFGRIIIVTNQRCVGKGIIDEGELNDIHAHLLQHINTNGQGVCKIYFAPNLNNDAHYRKPQIGMALQAQRDYPEINFSKSVMVGNSPSDIAFGKNAGMKTVFVTTTKPADNIPDIDIIADTLEAFAKVSL
jgi:D-glycero-D-manno-heptose 1,7-bisphosphate phosphatase